MPLLVPDGNAARKPVEQPVAEEQAPIDAVTAFIVFKLPDGSTVMHHDINLPITVQRPPSRDEVKGMCSNAVDDINNQEQAMLTTQQVIGNLMQMNQQAQRQSMSTAEIAALQKLNGVR